MRILLAHNSYQITGGAEVFVHEVQRILESNGHDVVYFAPFDNGRSDEWNAYCPQNTLVSDKSFARQFWKFPRSVYSLTNKKKIKRLINDFKPDIVHAFAIYSKLTPSILVAAKECGVPTILTCNDYKHLCPVYKLFHHGQVCFDCHGRSFYHCIINKCAKNSYLLSIASSLESYVHRILKVYPDYVDKFTFSSCFMASKTEELWGDEVNWSLLRNPFHSPQFKISESADDYILFFGRLVEEKGLEVLLESMRLYPDAHLKIVGDGPQAECLRQKATFQSLTNVDFLGQVWGNDLNQLIQNCRFVIVPSIWHENLPYVINQSYAFGKPVVGSDRGGIPELINKGISGLIYAAEDAGKLAECIEQLWVNPDLCKKMGKNAKVYSDLEFNDQVFYGNLMSIYQQVMI